MAIDWSIVAPIATSLIGAAIGAALNHVFERRPRLISYIGHVASHQIPQASGHPLHFFTHSVVLKNTGHKPANNVRLKHQFLPTYAVHPPLVAHTPEKYPVGQGGDIVFPKLVPQTEITISYLLFSSGTLDRYQRTSRIRRGTRKNPERSARDPTSSLGTENCCRTSAK